MVEGLDRLNRKLRTTIPASVEKATKAAMEKSAAEIVNMMKSLAPKDTGRVAESIGWTWGQAPSRAMVIAQSTPTREGLVLTIYAGGGDAFYAVFQEFGTKNMAPHPFFFPSYRANRTRARRRISRAMRQAIRKAAAA